jgi:predicted Zn-dependent protease
MAQLAGQLINLKYGRDDELESDRLAVRFMAASGYDPHALMRVMEILASAGNGQAPPEFFSSHPNPQNRIQQIQAAIDAEFPNGVPAGLTG